MIYAVVLTFALGSHVEDVTRTCPDLLCVAAVMVRAPEIAGLSRIRVFRGAPGLLSVSGLSVFPPILDERYL